MNSQIFICQHSAGCSFADLSQKFIYTVAPIISKVPTMDSGIHAGSKLVSRYCIKVPGTAS